MSTEHGRYFQLTLNVNVVWKNIVPFGTFFENTTIEFNQRFSQDNQQKTLPSAKTYSS
jgi:hypothetical protein